MDACFGVSMIHPQRQFTLILTLVRSLYSIQMEMMEGKCKNIYTHRDKQTNTCTDRQQTYDVKLCYLKHHIVVSVPLNAFLIH